MSDQVINGDQVGQKVEDKAEAVEKVEKSEIPKINIRTLANKIVENFKDQALLVRDTKAASYMTICTVEKTAENWKKGLFYEVNQYATGANIELHLYSCKKGAHLAEFKDAFNEFVGAKIGEETVQKLPYGLAIRLRLKLPAILGLEKAAEFGAEFIKLVNAKVEEIRTKITLPEKTKKTPKVKGAKAEGKAETKKGAKSKAKSKKPAPVVEKVETPVIDPSVDAAIDEIAPPQA